MKKTRVKFIGSAALIITTLGVLLAILGQLDFIGSERPESVAMKQQKSDKTKPKYSFYDDLKKRKVEVDKKGTVTNRATLTTTTLTSQQSDNYRYVVQAGALSKKTDAERVKQSLEKLGYTVRIVQSGRRHLVQVGPLKGKKVAATVEKELQDKKYPTLIKRLK